MYISMNDLAGRILDYMYNIDLSRKLGNFSNVFINILLYQVMTVNAIVWCKILMLSQLNFELNII